MEELDVVNSSPHLKVLTPNNVIITCLNRYLMMYNNVNRNCLVGKNFQVKISDFGTDNDAYSCDYYKVS